MREIATRTDHWTRVFATMIRIRLFEEKVADLIEEGDVRCPCHLYIGQEAIAAGVCAALREDDTVWGGHRSHGHYLAKGGDMAAMMAEIYGKQTGCAKGRGGSMHVFAPQVGILGTVPLVAASLPLAVGAALASKLCDERKVAIAFFGDGATEEGHFHECMNLAALYKLPLIFVCENNFYSSHMSLLERRARDNIAKAGVTHGLPGRAVDGNDVCEVYESAVEAVERARCAEGPTLLECRTYRWRGHVGPSWDEDVGLKRRDELGEWLPKDPVGRLKERLLRGGLEEEVLTRIEDDARAEVEESVDFARRSPYPDAGELEDHVFVCRETR